MAVRRPIVESVPSIDSLDGSIWQSFLKMLLSAYRF
jgi:hypothetical protein